MSYADGYSLSPAKEACAGHLSRVLVGLRALRADADEAHTLLADYNLGPDGSGCVPDELDCLIALVEARLEGIGARVPDEMRAAA